jgi:hypothetical protein
VQEVPQSWRFGTNLVPATLPAEPRLTTRTAAALGKDHVVSQLLNRYMKGCYDFKIPLLALSKIKVKNTNYSGKTRWKETKEEITAAVNFERELGHLGNLHFNTKFKKNKIFIWKEHSRKGATLSCLWQLAQLETNREEGRIGNSQACDP